MIKLTTEKDRPVLYINESQVEMEFSDVDDLIKVCEEYLERESQESMKEDL